MKQPVTRDMAKQIMLAKQAGAVNSGVRQSIQREAIASQQVDMSKFYYSRIRFEGAVDSEAGTITFIPQKHYAFGYQLQRQVDTHTGHMATYADTNLLEERATNRGERVEIVGISVRPTPFTDSYLMNALDMFVSVVMRLDNDNILYLGNPSDIPGCSQNSHGPSWVIEPEIENPNPPQFGACQKGTPEMDNILVLAEPVIWKPKGKDAKLDILFELNETFEHTFPADRAALDPTALGAADLAATTAWAPPAEQHEPGTFVDYFVKLYCKTTGPRGVNQ